MSNESECEYFDTDQYLKEIFNIDPDGSPPITSRDNGSRSEGATCNQEEESQKGKQNPEADHNSMEEISM